VETRAEIMRRHKDVVGAPAPVPERVLRRDEVDRGRDEGARVPNRGEAVDGAEVARHVNGDEEKVSFVRVKSSHLAGQQSPVNGNLRRKQMSAAPLVRQPIRVVLGRKIVYEHLQVLQRRRPL